MHTKTEKKYNSKAAKGFKAFLADTVASANPSSVVGESVVMDDSANLVGETRALLAQKTFPLLTLLHLFARRS